MKGWGSLTNASIRSSLAPYGEDARLTCHPRARLGPAAGAGPQNGGGVVAVRRGSWRWMGLTRPHRAGEGRARPLPASLVCGERGGA